jgi:hypothetical protein
VIIWPDNDFAGREYAEEVATNLLRLGSTVFVVDPQSLGLEETQDVANWLDNHPDAVTDSIWKLIENAEERSGQRDLQDLCKCGLEVSAFPDVPPNEIGLILPKGMVAIEIYGHQGAADEKGLASVGCSPGNTLTIKTGKGDVVMLFRWSEFDPAPISSEYTATFTLITSGDTIFLPANGRWSANVGEHEIAPFPASILQKWPAMLKPHSPGAFPPATGLSRSSLVLPAKEWPAPISDSALYGLAGEFVKLVGPQTEADPSALLVALLTGLGAMFDNSSYINVGATKHFTSLFCVIVGATAHARKGTATTEIRRFLLLIDPEFCKRIVSGLSTGEGTIESIRDPRTELVPSKDNDKPPEWKTVDAGVPDKRLLAIENEFAQVLQSMSRTGNTLSPVLREAWDGQPIGVIARSNKNRCENPHLALLASITEEELQQLLTRTDRSNGLANRIFWVCAKRSRELPHGGDVDQVALNALASQTRTVLEWAKNGRLVGWGSAKAQWGEAYRKLSEGEGQGIYGAITARAHPLVLRLALIYAILDKSIFIEQQHLTAALEVWRYCDESARHIFGDAIGDSTADAILTALRLTFDGLSQTQISQHFKGHRSSFDLNRALESLQQRGLIYSKQLNTKGRPTILWFAALRSSHRAS